MFDKRKSSDEGSSAPPQAGSDRKDAGEGIAKPDTRDVQITEHSGSGSPTGHYRQGYCSCCQVHYINLEKHLASDQHKQISCCKRNPFNSNILMERFLQDVHLYHPQNYQDTRPTYDDIPDVSTLPTSSGRCSCSLLPSQMPERRPTEACAKHTKDGSDFSNIDPCTSKYNSRKTSIKQECNANVKVGHCSTDHIISDCILTSSRKALTTAVNIVAQNSSCRTLYSCSPQTAKNILPSEALHCIINVDTNKNKTLQANMCGLNNNYPGPDLKSRGMLGLHDKPSTLQGSCYNLTSGVPRGMQSGIKSQGEIDHMLRNHTVNRDLKNDNPVKVTENPNQPHGSGLYFCQGYKSTVDAIIEDVIWKHCYGISSRQSSGKEEDSISSINIHSAIGCTENSSLSFDWDVQIQSEEDHSKTVLTNVDVLKESSVNIDDEYKSRLKSVLGSCPFELKNIKAEQDEDVLPALPHVPPSFVGKTWSQIKYEDDLKIEALVKQFRTGKFHCYFEGGNAEKKSKRRLKTKAIEQKDELETSEWKIPEDIHTLPSFNDLPCTDNDSDIPSVKSEKVVKKEMLKPSRRTWRLASRCQVVKVSHGTQTSLVNYPVIKKKRLDNVSEHSTVNDNEEERTPDMQTRMCALKLPETYAKILTPLQTKTTVYVLSHPDVKISPGKPACISKRGRNQYSTDSRDSSNFKYKQSPIKYYDPLTNRILKTPPRHSVRGLGSKGQSVRRLFKSLSSEGNVDKFDTEMRNATSSKKSFSSCSGSSVCFDNANGKDLNSSLKGSGSSIGTEHVDNQKNELHEKPYSQFSISPFKASHPKVKRDLLFAPSDTGTRKQSLGPNPADQIQQKNSKTRKKIKAVTEPKGCMQPKHGIVRKIEKITQGNVTRTRKQPLRKASMSFLMSSVPSFQALIPRQKKVTTSQAKDLPVKQPPNVNVCEKSQFVSCKSSKRKSNICKPARQSRTVRKPYESKKDQNINRTCSKASIRNVSKSLALTVSKPRVRTQPSRTRDASGSAPRRRRRR